MSVRSSVRGAMTSTKGLAASAAAVALLFFAASAEAQQGAVTGQVVGASNLQPVSGAQVFFPNLDLGTITNEEGRYRITGVPAGQHQLRVQVLGYRPANQTVAVSAGETVTVDIELDVSPVALQDVTVNVVTGQQQARRTQGSNTATIDMSTVEASQTQTFADILQGRSEGVRLQDVSGGTGTGQRIRIRGSSSLSLSNEPLVFVDGAKVSGGNEDSDIQIGMGGAEVSRLNDLSPEEIKSVEVIKGPAATSLYGAAAANGVLLITTKRGQSTGARWHFYAEMGSLTDETDYPANVGSFTALGDPDAPLWLSAETGATPDGIVEFQNPAFESCANFEAAAGECTQDVTRRFNTMLDPRTTTLTTGRNERFGGSVSGGGEDATYFVSASRLFERNPVPYNVNDRTNLRLNSEVTPSEALSLNVSTGFTDNDLTIGLNNNAVSGPLINGLGGFPEFVPGDGFGGGDPSFLNFGFLLNDDELSTRTNEFQTQRFIGSLNARFNPEALPWLRANATVGYDLSDKSSKTFLFAGDVPAFFPDGFVTTNRGEEEIWTANTSVTAEYDVNEWLSANTTVGGSYSEEREVTSTCSGASPTLGLPNCGATTELFAVDEDFSRIRSLAGFAQQEFSINDRLYVEGSIRVDDNSAFGGDLGVELFPGASVSWVMSEEPWFGESDVINQLRLRGAWGQSGVRPEFRDAQSLFSSVSATRAAGSQSATIISNSGNPELKPETVTEWEGGFDASFVNERISLQASYYYKESEDALVERQLAPSFGLTTSRFANIGSVRNQGIEANLNADALNTEEFGLSFGVNFTTVDNEILELGRAQPITLNRGEQAHKDGFPAGAYHLPKIEWQDANGDGILSVDEVSVVSDSSEFIDESTPTWEGSISTNLRLFRFVNIRALFDAQGGHSNLDATNAFRCGSFRNCRGAADPNAPLDEQAAFIADEFLGTNVGFIDGATFMKWRELSVRFDAPQSLAELSPLLRDASLTLAGRNLATWTDFSGLDPEINETGGDTNFTQGEFFTQPPVRVLTARLDFRF